MAKRKSSKRGNINQVPSGDHQTPGPINDPSNHPVDNIPPATDPRWGDTITGLSPGSELSPSPPSGTL